MDVHTEAIREVDGTPATYSICIKTNVDNGEKVQTFHIKFVALKFGLDKFSDIVWGFLVEIETDCQALKDILLSDQLNAAHARWRDSILAHRITNVCHVPGKLNVIADGLSRQWEGQPCDAGLQDGSTWTVSKDWEAEKGLVNDILLTSTIDEHTVRSLVECFANEDVFLEVVELLAQINSNKPLRDHK